MFPAARSHLPTIAPATVVSVDRGLYRHVGLLTEPLPGIERRVLSLNPGGPAQQLREETLSQFGRAQPVTLLAPWSDSPWSLVLARARSSWALPQYSWTHFNCEHFLCYAFGIPLQSPQLRQLALVAAATMATAVVVRSAT
jgi:hypothetical protein